MKESPLVGEPLDCPERSIRDFVKLPVLEFGIYLVSDTVLLVLVRMDIITE